MRRQQHAVAPMGCWEQPPVLQRDEIKKTPKNKNKNTQIYWQETIAAGHPPLHFFVRVFFPLFSSFL